MDICGFLICIAMFVFSLDGYNTINYFRCGFSVAGR